MRYVVIAAVLLVAVLAAWNRQSAESQEDIDAARKRYEEKCRQFLLERESRDINLDKEE